MSLVFFQSQPFTYPGGGLAVNVPVRVLFADATTLAPIYHNGAGARKVNPVRTDGNGLVSFWVEPGDYDLLANGITTPVTVDAGGDPETASTSLVLSVGSPGGIGTGRGRVYNDTGRTLYVTAVRMTALNAGGGGLVADVNINGSTIYSTQQNRPSLPVSVGTGTVKNTGFNVGAALADGDYVTIDVDQGTFDHLVVQVFVR